jgi:hypothetical protein
MRRLHATPSVTEIMRIDLRAMDHGLLVFALHVYSQRRNKGLACAPISVHNGYIRATQRRYTGNGTRRRGIGAAYGDE